MGGDGSGDHPSEKLGKFDYLGTVFTLNIRTLYLVFLFNKSILLHVNVCKIAG